MYAATANSSYPASGGIGGAGLGGGYGVSQYGGSQYGSSMNGGGQYGGAYNSAYAGGIQQQNAPATPFSQPATVGAAGASGATGDQTGTYLAASSGNVGVDLRPRIVPNPFDNTLLVRSTPEQWEEIRSFVEKLDVSPRQVLIEAKIYEVDLTGNMTAGVEAFLQKRGATNAGGLTQHQLTGSSASGALTLSAGTMVGEARELLATLEANEMQSRTKVLSSPTLIATDSIPAAITVGDTVPTLSSQGVNPGVTAGGNSLFTNTISNVSTGTGLNILAHVNPSGVVTMVINQSVTAPEATTSSTINSPSFSQRNVSTQVTVDDGDMIAIGGIIDETTTNSSQGIPFLDRIPYLGFLFGTKTSSKQRTELIVFLTPHVIADTHRVSDATQELKDQMKDLRKLMKQNP
jgi:general secretion pathway protein D